MKFGTTGFWLLMGGLFLIVAGIVLGTGCDATKDRLVFCAGGAPAEVAEWKKLLVEFGANHPALDVRLQALPADSDLQLQAMGAALGSGKAPFDVMRLDVVWMADFSSRGWVQPLDEIFGPAQLAAFGRLPDDLDRFDGKLMGIPWNVDIGLLYSRKDMLEELGLQRPPRSFAELKALAIKARAIARLAEMPPAGFLWQGKAYEGLMCNFMEAYARAGGSAASVEKDGRWDPGAASAAMWELKGLVETGLSPANTATEMDEEGTRLLFQSGKAMFMRNWPYAAPLLEARDSSVRGKVIVSALPGASAGPGPGTLGGWHLAIRSGTAKSKLAGELIAFLSSTAVQVRLARSLGWNPSRLDAYAEFSGSNSPPHLKAVRLALQSAIRRPRRQKYAAFSEKTFQAVNQAMLGRIAVEEAVQKINAP